MIILALYIVGMFLFITSIFVVAGFAGEPVAKQGFSNEDLIGITLLSTIWPLAVPLAILFVFAWLMMKLTKRIIAETAKR